MASMVMRQMLAWEVRQCAELGHCGPGREGRNEESLVTWLGKEEDRESRVCAKKKIKWRPASVRILNENINNVKHGAR